MTAWGSARSICRICSNSFIGWINPGIHPSGAPVCAEYWDTASGKMHSCCDDRPGCQVLQTVMIGSFADFIPSDHVNVRVFSSALTRLCAVTEEDFHHFMQSFKVDENTLQKNYFTALANCLWADILIASVVDDPQAQQARTILRLFLEPATQPEQTAQQNAIRLAMDAHAVMMIAGHSGMPPEFICHVMGLQDPIR